MVFKFGFKVWYYTSKKVKNTLSAISLKVVLNRQFWVFFNRNKLKITRRMYNTRKEWNLKNWCFYWKKVIRLICASNRNPLFTHINPNSIKKIFDFFLNRIFPSDNFKPIPVKKYSKLPILDHFEWYSWKCIFYFFWRIVPNFEPKFKDKLGG